MGGEEACCSHFTLLVRQRRVCPAVESPKKTEFLSGDRQQASLAFRFAPTRSSGHPLVAYLLEVTLLLARCVAQVCWVPFCHVWDICVFLGGEWWFLLLCSSCMGQGCPALCRVRLPLDVGEEVEQHGPEGSDSAAFSLLLIIVTLLIFLSAASSL